MAENDSEEVLCPYCGRTFKAIAELEEEIRCPHCKEIFILGPDEEE